MGKITIDEMHNSLFDYAQAVSDENLITESKTVVGAINEIYGKKLIANAIGEPLNSTDTYAKMNNDINSLLSTFKTNMMNSGVTVNSSDKFKQLIEKIKGLTEGEGNKGIQYASGTIAPSELKLDKSFINYYSGSKYEQVMYYLTINSLSFTPSIIIITGSHNHSVSGIQNTYGIFDILNNIPYHAMCVSADITDAKNLSGSFTGFRGYPDVNVSNSIDFPLGFGSSNYITPNSFTWHAFGVGEEDTTLRDSLASILQDEGVEVTPEDDMASLITKVDEEFDNRKQILVNALVNEGLNAKITNTYEELITMISLLKYVPANSIINGNSTDSDFINGLKSYSRNRGDADSKITYSVSNNTIIVEGSADCVETTNGQADEGKRDLYIYNPSYTVDVTDYDVFKVIASYSFYDMEYGSLEVGLYTGSDYKNPVKTIENGDLNITDLTGEYHIVINAFVWNEYYLGKTGILEGKVSYIGFE